MLVVLLGACRKKPDTKNTTNEGNIQIAIENVAGPKPIKINDEWYVTRNGDSIKVLIFNYFISNITLVGNNSYYTEEESYHLINSAENDSKIFSLKSIPNGTYKKMSFLIGVDSTRNVSGVQTGALDVNSGMFWDWKTGYIMAKLEALSPQSPNDNMVIYHLSGYTGPYSSLRTVELDLPKPITINNNTSSIKMHADILEWFTTPTNIKIEDLYFSMSPDKNSATIADNYVNMFSIKSIE